MGKDGEGVPRQRPLKGRLASASEPQPREKLPDDLQKLVDREDELWDQLYEGQGADSTDTSLRYAAYARRIRTILLSAHRYVAYTSDIGESFRPIAHPYLVKGAYAISWAYIIGDVGHEGYKAYRRNQKLLSLETRQQMDAKAKPTPTEPTQSQPPHIPALEDYRAVMAQRAVFQSIASMGLPAFTIHSIVRYSGRVLKNASNVTLRTWGPVGLGLAVVPALPYIFDKPVEEAVEWVFYNGFKAIGGESEVGPRHRRHHGDAPKALERAKEKVKEL